MPDKFTTNIEDLEHEIEVEFYKSSGPGGQHRNKTATAVRIRHIPSGLTVTCEETRSQSRNRKIALERLSEKLKKKNRPKKKRKPSKPTQASKEKRLKDKKAHSEKKTLRKKVEEDNG